MNRFPGQFGQGTGFMQQVEQGSQQTFGVLASPTHPLSCPAQLLTSFSSSSSY